MNLLEKEASIWLSQCSRYFWRWSMDEEVIEWQDGETLCFSGEFEHLLELGMDGGWLPAGAQFLLLFASRSRWDGEEHRAEFARVLKEKIKPQYVGNAEKFRASLTFLEKWRRLPLDLKTAASIARVQSLIGEDSFRFLPPEKAREYFRIWKAGKAVITFRVQTADEVRQENELIFSYFQKGNEQFGSSAELANWLRAGVLEPPSAIDSELPEPEEENLSLLDKLADDPKTEGLARLTRRIMVALHIPMQQTGSGDLPLGGVSDITNRGDFDRLLLSELAYEDDTLIARLANNEALYYRREEPPVQVDRERIVFIDSTLKIWGTARIFALASALGIGEGMEAGANMRAAGVGGNNFEELDLSHPEGVIDALSRLDAALHPAGGIAHWFAEQKPLPNQEFVFITTPGIYEATKQSEQFQGGNLPLHFLITVEADGQIEWFSLFESRRKILGKARFDLDELLYAPGKRRKKKRPSRRSSIDKVPAIYSLDTFPLLWPSSAVRFIREKFAIRDETAVGVTDDDRLMFWPKRGKGGIELAITKPDSFFCFGYENPGRWLILESNYEEGSVWIHSFNTANPIVETRDISAGIRPSWWVVYESGAFFVLQQFERADAEVTIYDFHKDIFRPPISSPEYVEEFRGKFLAKQNHFSRRERKFVNTGYTVKKRVGWVGLTKTGALFCDNSLLELEEEGLRWGKPKQHLEAFPNPERLEITDFPVRAGGDFRFTSFTFPDGSRILTDSRGLVTLQPSDEDMPEVSIFLILGQTTAAWASDGTYSGNETLLPLDWMDSEESMRPLAFYHAYIRPFLELIRP